ncbi:MAG: hypothetical protein DHS20C15_12620 [Planctomycetota bacterium]|nr:MAG: hypothetical protein DHS20C15_12620 [Planctomycetota bacterium]
MAAVVKLLKFAAAAVATVALLGYLALFLASWRELTYPWTDRGDHWATLHVQNDSDVAVGFQHLAPGVADLEGGAGNAKHNIVPGTQREFGVIPVMHGRALGGGGPTGAGEIGCLLRLPDDTRMLFPVVLRVGDHLRVRVHPDGSVSTSRGDESLVGWVTFGDEQSVVHAPPPGAPWRSFSSH